MTSMNSCASTSASRRSTSLGRRSTSESRNGDSSSGEVDLINCVTSSEAEKLILNAFSKLGRLAKQLACVVTQDNVDVSVLHRLGFGWAGRLNEFDPTFSCKCILVLEIGTDGRHVLSAVRKLTFDHADVVPVFAFMIPTVVSSSPEEAYKKTASMSRLREMLFLHGSDDVIVLHLGEALTALRLFESLQRAEYLASKASAQVLANFKHMEAKTRNHFQNLQRKFVMTIPSGNAENIPPEDKQLQEHVSKTEGLVGVASCRFQEQIGSGPALRIYKGRDEELGTCAITVVSKVATKSAIALIMLDREIGHLFYSPEHPNIAKGLQILHGPDHVYVFATYSGRLRLDLYRAQALERDGAESLPTELVGTFARQQASAVAWLHVNKIVHRDLRPESWCVSDCSRTVTLTAMGKAIRLSGIRQTFTRGGGTLPYCSPEEFQENPTKDNKSYDGAISDVWSLGMGFLFLLIGTLGIMQTLGFNDKEIPSSRKDLGQAFENLQDKVQELHAAQPTPFSRVCTTMVRVAVSERSTMDQVGGSAGLGLQKTPVPPTRPNSGTRGRGRPPPPVARTPSPRAVPECSGVRRLPGAPPSKPPSPDREGASGRDESPARPSFEFVRSATSGQVVVGDDLGDVGRPLSARLGGEAQFSAAVKRMLEQFVRSPSASSSFKERAAELDDLHALHVKNMHTIMDSSENSAQSQVIRAKFFAVYSDLPFQPAHYMALVDRFGSVLKTEGIQDDAVREAAQRLTRLMPNQVDA